MIHEVSKEQSERGNEDFSIVTIVGLLAIKGGASEQTIRNITNSTERLLLKEEKVDILSSGGGFMQNERIGNVIKALRVERKLTQKQLADKLGISDKAVSKWERGLGAPELSLISELSDLLDVNIRNLLSGNLSRNDFVSGNMRNSKYYICPHCQNITVCTGNAEVYCCGKILTAQTAVKATDDQELKVEIAEGDWYITSQHPMNKEHYISFVAFATGDRVQIIKQYPEWNLDLRIQKHGHGMLIWYCVVHGLFYQSL